MAALQSVPLCCMAAARLANRGSKLELEPCMSTALACRLQGLGSTWPWQLDTTPHLRASHCSQEHKPARLLFLPLKKKKRVL